MNSIQRIVKYLGGAVLGVLLMMILPAQVVSMLNIQNPFIEKIVSLGIMILILTVLIIAFGQKDVFKFSFSSFENTFIVGGVMTVITAFYFVTEMHKAIRDYGTPAIDSTAIIAFFLYVFLGAGVREELVARGFLLTFIQKAFGNSKASYIFAMASSSIFFGLMHLSNLDDVTDPTPIYAQIIYAIGIGFFLAALYLRTGNLWGNMLLHFLFDVSLMIYPYIYANRTDLSTLIGEWLGSNIILKSILMSVGAAALGLFLIRDSKFKPGTEVE